MLFRAALVLALSALQIGLANAEVKGVYITGAGTVHQVRDSDTSGAAVGTIESAVGFGGGLAVGYQFGNGIRIEGEHTYYSSKADRVNGAARSDRVHAITGMTNLLWEYDNSSGIYPYAGAGLGAVFLNSTELLENSGLTGVSSTIAFAAQGIAGVGFALTPNLTGVAEYRYLHAFDPRVDTSAGTIELPYRTHAVSLGLRYRFGKKPQRAVETRRQPVRVVRQESQPAQSAVAAFQSPTVVTPVAATPRPLAQAKAAGSLRRTYVVFFATDSAVLNRDARAIVVEATEKAKQDQTKVIDLTGHADTTGASVYNQRLSVRRAESAAAMLRSGGVAARLRIFGKGETDLLVPTADNVSEPRNRRVEIVLRGVDDGLVVSQN